MSDRQLIEAAIRSLGDALAALVRVEGPCREGLEAERTRIHTVRDGLIDLRDRLP